MRRLEGRAGIVAGGGSGIGRAIAIRLAAEGAKVAILDRNGVAAEAVARDIAVTAARTVSFQVDISDYARVAEAVEQVEAELGPTAFLVNSVGWGETKPFLDSDPESWKKLIDVNLIGSLNVLHIVGRRMVAHGGGRIVSVASDAARVGAGGSTVYGACKAGVIAMTKCLARELASAGVILNVVSPGPTDTPLLEAVKSGPDGARWLEAVTRSIPLRRLGTPEDFAGPVAMLLSDEGSYITGQTISISGGLTMI